MTTTQHSRTVLITGGTGSVGRALVEAFTKANYRVSFQYWSHAAEADNLAKEFAAEPIRIDFSQDFTLLKAEFDVLINNAGINLSDQPTAEVAPADWLRTLQINLTAPFLVIRQCLPAMVKNRSGRIVNISSIYGLRAVEGNLPYTVSKHGLSGLTKTVAKEYADVGVTCNEICPGPIDSTMMREIAKRSIAQSSETVEGYLLDVCNAIPARRMADPREIAALVLFLASPEAGYITGASIPVDGGLIA
jgi:NAD(P)-dependent dehydrogenase (short-subunit alcohol dehydrogenase family)